MSVACAVQPNVYFDSVFLMKVAAELSSRAGVVTASLLMGTTANKRLLRDAGLLTDEGERAAANDLIIAVAVEGAGADALLADARGLLNAQEGTAAAEDGQPQRPRTLAQAAAGLSAGLAIVSTPGSFAAAEALKALRLGMHVFLFSDNVTLAEEIELKHEAERRDLLVMGPDCGTAIIGGAPLGFANAVRTGAIGLVGASGTGLQQISTLIDAAGEGISQMIGVGGRDLSREVGGASMVRALDALAADPATAVIVLVSKPPDDRVAQEVLERAARAEKPVVVCFIGSEIAGADGQVRMASTLESAALAAVALRRGDSAPSVDPRAGTIPPRPGGLLRALYSGGTFAYEAQALLGAELGAIEHEIPMSVPGQPVSLPDRHLILDLGDDAFTVGRPHPMIDATVRAELLYAAADDPRSGVIVLDVVLGHGAADNPVGPLLPGIRRAAVRRDGPAVVAFVVGTDGDPQDRDAQERQLSDAGASVWPSSTAALRVTATALAPVAEGHLA